MRIFVFVLLLTSVFFLSACDKKSAEIFTEDRTETMSEQSQGQASFAIFTNGTFRVFTNSKYHNLSQEVFITSASPNTITYKEGKTWGDFFSTLPMELTDECLTTGTGQEFCNTQINTLKFYINGKIAEDFLNTQIQNGDKALISYGPTNDPSIPSQLNQIPKTKSPPIPR